MSIRIPCSLRHISLVQVLLHQVLLLLCLSSCTSEGHHDHQSTQHRITRLRDAASVSDSPNATARYSSARLTRSLVSPSAIWPAVDGFTRMVLQRPDLLDMYVATVDSTFDTHDTVVVHAAFSCLDVGASTGLPLYWWAAKDLQPLRQVGEAQVGGAETGPKGHASATETFLQCWRGREPKPDMHLVAHSGFHRGAGMTFRNVSLDPPTLVNRTHAFDDIRRARLSESSLQEVLIHPQLQLPVVFQLPFVTGLRLFVPPETPPTQTRELRVPLTPLLSARRHFGFRLEEALRTPAEPRTSLLILITSVLAVGLPLLLGVWIVLRLFSDHSRQREMDMRSEGVEAVIRGDVGAERATVVNLLVQLIGVVILITPLVNSIATGDADPRPSVEVTTGVSIMYGPSNENMSLDTENDFAGSPFIITVFLSVRDVDGGHYVAFTLTLLFIAAFAMLLFVRESRNRSEGVPNHLRSYHFWSVWWKLAGAARLYVKSKWRSTNEHIYTFEVQFRRLPICTTDAMKLIMLTNAELRRVANEMHADRAEPLLDEASHDLLPHLEPLGKSHRSLRLFGTVVLRDALRYQAMMSGTSGILAWVRTLPRAWYRLTSWDGMHAPAVQHYRTNGKFMDDRFLVAARIGLLPYLHLVRRILLFKVDDANVAVDTDGVRVAAVLAPRSGETPGCSGEVGGGGGSSGGGDGSVEVVKFRQGEALPGLLGRDFPWAVEAEAEGAEGFEYMEKLALSYDKRKVVVQVVIDNREDVMA